MDQPSKLPPKANEPRLPLTLANASELVPLKSHLLRAAEAFQPILSEYAKAQQGLEQIARELNKTWYVGLPTDALAGIRSLIDHETSWKRFFEANRPFAFLREIDEINARLRDSLGAVSVFNSIVRQDTFIRLYTESVRTVDWNNLSTTIRDAALRIHETFLPTLDAFSLVRESLFQHSDSLVLARIPTREHFLTTDLLYEITPAAEGEEAQTALFKEERASAQAEIEDQMFLTLPAAISKIDPNLYPLWLGAWQAFTSENVDRIRHALVSVRELVTQVLHALAPDNQVKAWTQSPEHYSNGRPTRQARLLFIHRKINDGAMKAYCEKEIRACLSLIDIFQEGTHGIISSLSQSQVRVILRRVHSTVCTLVEIHLGR